MNPYIILAFLGWVVILSVVAFNVFNITGFFVVSNVSNITQTNNIPKVSTETVEQQPKCPISCDDSNPCTIDWCNQTSGYSCVNDALNGTTTEGCFGSFSACRSNMCITGKCVEIN